LVEEGFEPKGRGRAEEAVQDGSRIEPARGGRKAKVWRRSRVATGVVVDKDPGQEHLLVIVLKPGDAMGSGDVCAHLSIGKLVAAVRRAKLRNPATGGAALSACGQSEYSEFVAACRLQPIHPFTIVAAARLENRGPGIDEDVLKPLGTGRLRPGQEAKLA